MNGFSLFDAAFYLHSAMTLLHFLWQGLLLAVVACVAAWCLRNRSAAARYRVHAATLLLMPMCLPVTFMFLHQEEVLQAPDLVLSSQAPAQPFDVVLPIEVPAETPHATAVADTSSSAAMEAATVSAPPAKLPADNLAPVDSIVSQASTDPGTSVERIARWTTAAYLIGVGLMFVRMLLGLAGTRRLRRDAQRIDDARLLQSIERRARQFRLRSAPLVAYCNRVAVPALAGLWRPMILLPTSLATGLTPEQLDLVIMHEMAHIRRWDNLWLVVQRVVESTLFFHPAVWCVSRRMSLERELCCDEMVVAMATRRADYAESLLRVVELTTDKQLAVPATATMASPRDGSAILVHRLMRILGEPKSSPVRLPGVWPTAIMGVLVISAIGFVRLSVYAKPTDSAPEQAAEQEPTEEPGKMEWGCLACHESRLTPFADGDVAPQDRLEVGDVLAAVRVEIMPKWAVETNVDLNDAYPNIDASNEPFEGTVSPGGSCRDADGNPVADAEVVLYQLDWNTRSQTVVERSRTDRQGRFRFQQVTVSLDQTEKYGIVARAAGLTTEVQRFPYRTCWGDEIEQIELTMEKASAIHGRVTGPDGAPVERAMVWTESPLYDPIVGIHCALTDADGEFVIDDVAPRDRDSLRQTRVLPGGREVITISDGYRLCCRHPKFAHQWQRYVEVPSEVSFSLGLGAALEGRIVYAGSNEPAAGVGVRIISAEEGDYRQGVTDEQGRYRFVSLRGEKYNIWPVSTEWTAPAIDSIQAVSGETTKTPDVRLVRGAVIRGRLVHGVTGKPLTLVEFCTPVDQRVSVYLAVKGPDRPNSGPVHHGVTFRNDGSFEVRLPPGESMITFTPPKPWKMFNSAIGVERTLSLVDGQDRRLDLWVIRR